MYTQQTDFILLIFVWLYTPCIYRVRTLCCIHKMNCFVPSNQQPQRTMIDLFACVKLFNDNSTNHFHFGSIQIFFCSNVLECGRDSTQCDLFDNLALDPPGWLVGTTAWFQMLASYTAYKPPNINGMTDKIIGEVTINSFS